MSRKFNFSAGPAMLPEEVLQQVQAELLDWNSSGMSVMEMPHRGDFFEGIANQAEQDLRELLKIPSNYKVLFLQGGGRTQFAMVPMNLAKEAECVAYSNTGTWSQFAIEEAKRYNTVHIAIDSEGNNYTNLPDKSEWNIPDNAAYLHYTDNETIQGLEFSQAPDSRGIPLISDMSSNLLSKPLEINQYGLIYACAQKNLGPSGITMVIIRDDLLAREPIVSTPSMLRYKIHAENNSLYNTPACFAWYVCGLVFKWVKNQGGVEEMARRAKARTDELYHYIDASGFYNNPVNSAHRSKMNVVFTLKDEKLDGTFLKNAEKAGLMNLKGHRSVGGMRASLYNSMPKAGVAALLQFMREFAAQHG